MNRKFRKLCIPLGWTVAVVAVALSPLSYAADWKITPSLDLSETYTDNVRLASSGTKKSDYVTEVSPGISATGTGARMKINMNYRMQNLAHAKESSKITTNHQLDANAKAELIEELFFLDGKAGLSQQNISLFGAQPTDNTNITGNRATVATYSISPYLRHRFGSIATTDLRYTHDEVRTRVGGLSNSKGDSALFNLNSGPASGKLGWGLHYNKHKTDYSNNPSVETESYSGDLRFMITHKFSLTASKSYEKHGYLSTAGTMPEERSWTTGLSWTPSSKISIQASMGEFENNYLSTSMQPKKRFWTGGISWTPTARTSIQASTGHRFFGKTKSLAASHHSRNSVWSVNYSEDITTTQSQFQNPHETGIAATTGNADLLDKIFAAQYPNSTPADRKLVIDNAIKQKNIVFTFPKTNYFSNRFFLQKQLQATVALNSAKSTLILSAFNSLQEAQTAQGNDSLISVINGTNNLALNDKTKQFGGNALWNWRYTPRTSVNISLGHTKSRSISTGITDTNRTMGLGMTRQFQPKMNGSVNLRHNERDSNQSGSSYRENAITAALHMTF